MFRNNMFEYVRMILRTKSSYRLMDEVINDIEDIEQKKKLRAQLGECMKDVNTLIDELKKHGELF